MVADALPRMLALGQILACSYVKPLWLQEVLSSYATDSHAQELLA
jgi:hypothetical protein